MVLSQAQLFFYVISVKALHEVSEWALVFLGAAGPSRSSRWGTVGRSGRGPMHTVVAFEVAEAVHVTHGIN